MAFSFSLRFIASSESAVFLGFPDKEMYRVKVELPLQEIVKAERATSDAVSLSRELFSAIFKEKLETSPPEVNCTKTNDKKGSSIKTCYVESDVRIS